MAPPSGAVTGFWTGGGGTGTVNGLLEDADVANGLLLANGDDACLLAAAVPRALVSNGDAT